MSDPNLGEDGQIRSVSDRLKTIEELPEPDELNFITRAQLKVSLTDNMDRSTDNLMVAQKEAERLGEEGISLRCKHALRVLRGKDRIAEVVEKSVARLQLVDEALEKVRGHLRNAHAAIKSGDPGVDGDVLMALGELAKL